MQVLSRFIGIGFAHAVSIKIVRVNPCQFVAKNINIPSVFSVNSVAKKKENFPLDAFFGVSPKMLLIFEKMKKSTNKSDFMISFGSKWSGRSHFLPIFGRF